MYEGTALIDVLNDLRSRELAVTMQYMRHHYCATGADGVALAGEFKNVAIAEMKHAEALAERIDYLEGDPTTRPEAIMGMDVYKVVEMAAVDRDSEADAIARYKEAIKVAEQADDVTTRKLLEDILGDEEEHHKVFSDMAG